MKRAAFLSLAVVSFAVNILSVSAQNHNDCRLRDNDASLAYDMTDVSRQDTLRLLAIGNSFSADAVEQYLYELLKADGREVIIGNLYIGGCPLSRHWDNTVNETPDYQYRKVVNGIKTNRHKTTLQYALNDEKWDYISLQENNSGWSTFDQSMPVLLQMLGYLRTNAPKPNTIYLFQQSWSDAQASTDKNFIGLYRSSQQYHYQVITDAVKRVFGANVVDGIVPSGTAVQNGRTSYLGDTFNRDCRHLELTYGRYMVSCVWFEVISGHSVVGNGYAPDTIDERQKTVAQNAAHFAVLKPFEVTNMGDF